MKTLKPLARNRYPAYYFPSLTSSEIAERFIQDSIWKEEHISTLEMKKIHQEMRSSIIYRTSLIL